MSDSPDLARLPPQPAVSIVLPTYNRCGTLQRAIRSVQAQSHVDWELLVVDDGSKDGTQAMLASLDEPRIRVITQANAGASAARNVGVRASRGRLITFLDSDDEWLPHFLALTCGFLDRHPQETWVATESLEAKADGRFLRQDLQMLSGHYVDLARHIGSTSLDLPPGTQDDYLRVYETCQPAGDWALPLAHAMGCDETPVRWYRGMIGEKYRWGYYHALWCIVLRREALAHLSPLPEHRRNCDDLQFLIELSMRWPCNLLAVPAVKKNLVAASGAVAGQLTAGRAYISFASTFAEVIEQCFARRLPDDTEVQRLYAFRRLEAGKAALAHGLRRDARPHVDYAARWLHWPEVTFFRLVAWLAPTDRIAALAYSLYDRIQYRLAHRH